ncbi:MAG: CDP-alcohol phosphatidyltransferase family protein [Candidatus Omnitrophica bacterium]|nr:CDP-alcohol phosphatidyltransferase family protein [Candidatus Omnitrophota bacterium]
MSLADKLTTIRIVLIPVFVSLLIYSQSYHHLRHIATIVFIIAVLSDFFDGLAARIRKEKSEFGQVLDPVADKLLLFAAFISLYVFRETLPLDYKMPLGIILVIVSRDLIILLGVIIINVLKKQAFMEPSFLGKMTTFFQMFTILALLFNSSFFPWIWKGAVFFTLASGVDYFLRGVRVLNGNDKTFNP